MPNISPNAWKHLERQPFRFGCSTDVFPMEEIGALSERGRWMDALASGMIAPTSAERSAVVTLPRRDFAHRVKDLANPADGIATCLVVPAEWRTDVAGLPLERAVDLNAAGSLDNPPDVRRPDAASREDDDAVACGFDQPGEEFVVTGVGHHPRNTKVDELLNRLDRVGDKVEGAVEDDTGGGEPPELQHVDLGRGGEDADSDLAINPLEVAKHDRQLRLAVAKPARPRAQHGDNRQTGSLGAGEGARSRSEAIDFQGGIELQTVGAGAGGRLRIGRGSNCDFEQDARVHYG